MSQQLAGDGDIEITRAQNRNYALADGFDRMARRPSNTWSLFLRYQAQAERQYRRAVEEFDRVKRLRPDLRNEPILETQPEENEPAYVPAAEPISPVQPDPEPPINVQPPRAHKQAAEVGQRHALPSSRRQGRQCLEDVFDPRTFPTPPRKWRLDRVGSTTV
jgi:hypothetical protein